MLCLRIYYKIHYYNYIIYIIFRQELLKYLYEIFVAHPVPADRVQMKENMALLDEKKFCLKPLFLIIIPTYCN